MDRIRDNLRRAMARAGKSEFALSKALGRNEAYINQYLASRQKTLPHEVRVRIAELLKMPPDEMDILLVSDPAAAPRPGLSESDAEPYTPPPGSYLAPSQHIAYFRMRSRALDQHPERIMPGHLLAFDINRVGVAEMATGTVVLAQLMDRHEMLKGHGTVVRVFMAPNKLITNSSGPNEIVSLDDEALPYIIVIRGVLLSVMRELN